VARGSIPGSEQAVRKINPITLKNKIAAKTGIAGLRRLVKYGQLKYENMSSSNKSIEILTQRQRIILL
jgi:hypothetical protein